MAVHDGGQVAPVTADLEISDVDNPDLVGSINLDRMCPAFDAGQERCQPRASPVQPCRTGPDNYFSHQTLDPTPADRLALPVQRRMLPGAAEGLKAVVVPGSADAMKAAHRSHGARFLMVTWLWQGALLKLDHGVH